MSTARRQFAAVGGRRLRRVRPGVRPWLLGPSVVLLVATAGPAEAAVELRVRENLAAAAVWSGRVVVERAVSVAPGATLTIRPGALVLFAAGAGLVVEGDLIAEGTPGRPIQFTAVAPQPGRATWAGIMFKGEGGRSRLRHCAVRNAGGLTIAAGEPRIEDCEISDGSKGVIVSGVGTRPALERNRLIDLRDGGIECLLGAAPLVADSTLERCGGFGVVASQNAAPSVLRNTIASCGAGVSVSSARPDVRENVFRNNGIGIALTQVSGGRPIQGNRLVDNEVGIRCQQFSSPAIVGNVISGSGEGIVCFQGGRALIRNNELTDNATAISCVQLADAEITANLIRGNRRAIYLQSSSYAAIHGNNLVDNEVQLELGDKMSADWERRATAKPPRGLQQQQQGRLQRATPPRLEPLQDLGSVGGFVDARENWWGEDATDEMERKGPDADISGLIDAFDVPTQTYEGYEGSFASDRIRYHPWARTPIADAGVPAPAAIEPAAE